MKVSLVSDSLTALFFQLFGKGELLQLSFAAISLVTKVPDSEARQILADFFAALVEVSRRTTKEVRIAFKGLGFLHLFKNRELAFQHVDKFAELTVDELAKNQAQVRDDLSYIADNASAVLSIGGGSTFSVRSSTLGSLASMQTPRSVRRSEFGGS